MVVRHTEPAVRPEDVLTGLRLVAGLAPASAPAVTRMAQGVLGPDDGDREVVPPMPAKVPVTVPEKVNVP
jgi:hypothetical protein